MPEPISTRPPRMAGSDFRLDISGFRSNIWAADLRESQTFDQCLEPSFWMDVVTKVLGDDKTNRRGLQDQIVARQLSTMRTVVYSIVGIGPGFIKLQEFQRTAGFTVPETKANSALKIRWNPGKKGHEVIRLEGADGAQVTVLSPTFQTKPEAVEWVNKFSDEMAA